MNNLSSVNNDLVKKWYKLTLAKERKKEQSYLVEGEHLVDEAIKSKALLKALIINERELERYQDLTKRITNSVPIYIVNDAIATKISQTKNTQGIFLEIEADTVAISDLLQKTQLVLLDQVQNPGNLGTIIRSADAFGYDGVLLSQSSVDPLNDKVIRSAQGSHFHLPIAKTDLSLKELYFELKQKAFTIYATALCDDARLLDTIEFATKKVIVIGNEAQGISEESLLNADQLVTIPITGHAESLNAGVAAGIVLYQAMTKS